MFQRGNQYVVVSGSVCGVVLQAGKRVFGRDSLTVWIQRAKPRCRTSVPCCIGLVASVEVDVHLQVQYSQPERRTLPCLPIQFLILWSCVLSSRSFREWQNEEDGVGCGPVSSGRAQGRGARVLHQAACQSSNSPRRFHSMRLGREEDV